MRIDDSIKPSWIKGSERLGFGWAKGRGGLEENHKKGGIVGFGGSAGGAG